MVFNATFNNISAISWRSVLWLVEEIRVPGENRRPSTPARHWQTLWHLARAGFELKTLVVMGTDCINTTTNRSRPRRTLNYSDPKLPKSTLFSTLP